MELKEKDFIQEGYSKHPASFWGWLFFCIIVAFGVYQFTKFSEHHEVQTVASNPFLQVTNREFSLFLWQNPGFMKSNLKSNRNYLPAWEDRLTPDPEQADEWVEATPEALFMYHTWKRLVGDYNYARNITQTEFLEFLEADPQWKPHFWKQAPLPYATLMEWIGKGGHYDNMRELSYKELPLIVRQAFVGWKNYTREKEAIDAVKPTWRQMWTFIDVYPNFKRPFWINFLRDERPDYLEENGAKGPDFVPESAMIGLLKMAIYNYLQRDS